jgi:uncharacterized membrane protein HdeD (DUF308 family)
MDTARYWWVFVITGTLWLLFAIIMLRFDWATVSSIAILFGIVMLAAAAMEVLAVFATHGWWRVLHLGLALAFIVVGIVAFIHPGNTFAALAAVFSFYFIFKGAFTIVWALFTRRELDLWWLTLLVGVAELLLGVWAAGYYGRSAVLLAAWIAAMAIARGLTEILFAFSLRHEHA